MKNKLSLLATIILLSVGVFLPQQASAQAPDGVNYQAVVRNNLGLPLNTQAVSVRFTIHQSSPTGTSVFQELHATTTNQFGLINLELGSVNNGAFSVINWGTGGAYYLQIEVDAGTGFDDLGASQLLSVPFALFARSAATGAQGFNSLIDTVSAGAACPTGGYQVLMGLDANANTVLDAGEVTSSFYVCNGGAGSGDNWGTDVVNTSGANITGDGTIGNPIIVTDADSDPTNELELPLIGNTTGDVMVWNGTSWVAQAPAAAGDNWGTDVVNTSGTNITGDGTSGNPLIVTDAVNDADFDPTNEIELPASAVFNQVLTWNGSAWVAQNPGSGADNWGSQVVITDSTMSGDGSTGNPLSGFDGNYSSLTGAPTNVSTFTNDVPYLSSFTEVDGSVTNELQTISFTSPNLTLSNGGGTVALPTGTVTSVGFAVPAQFSIAGTPLTTSGTITLGWQSNTQNLVLATPNGAAGQPSFRALVANDIPVLNASKITTGILPLVRGGSNASLTAVNGGVVYSTATAMAITPVGIAGQVLTSAGAGVPTWSTINTGTVTNVATGAGLIGGPITTTGTISIATNGVTNGMLANSDITLATGVGLTPAVTIPLGGTGSISLSNTTVAPGSYGSATQVPQFSVDAQGRLVNATNIAITGTLPAGASGQTLYNNAGTWTSTSNLYHDGTNIGIGTTTPQTKLHINSPDSLAMLIEGTNPFGTFNVTKSLSGGSVGELYTSGADTVFQSLEPGKKSFYVNYPRVGGKIEIQADTIQFSGNGPFKTITRNSGNFYNQDTIFTPELYVYNGAGIPGNILTDIGGGRAQWQPLAPAPLTFWSPSGPDIYNNNPGNVGIGTTTPLTLLDLNGNSTGSYIRLLSGNAANFAGIQLGTDVTRAFLGVAATPSQFSSISTQNDFVLRGTNEDLILAIQNNIGSIRFSTGSAPDTEKITISNSGNLGIGTTTPINKLDVEGGMVLGTSYSGTATAPSEGLLVQGNVGIGTTAPGMIAGSTNYLTIASTGPYAAGSIASIELKGNTNSANSVAAKIDFLNGPGTNNTARIEVITSGGSTAQGQLLFYTNGGSLTEKMRINQAGNVGIGTTLPTFQLQLATNSAAKPTSNVWTVASDARLKKDVKPFEDGLSDVLKINPVWFTYNGKAGMPDDTGVGVIAQELQKVAPFMVKEWEYKSDENTSGEKYLGVDNGAMTYMLINAIKEQQKMINDLKKEVELLKNK